MILYIYTYYIIINPLQNGLMIPIPLQLAQRQQLMQIRRICHLLHRRFQLQLGLVQVTLLKRWRAGGLVGGWALEKVGKMWKKWEKQ